MMKLDRRQFVVGSTAAIATLSLGVGLARAENSVDDLIKEFTGGADAGEGKLTLNAPEIAENGNTVPIGIDVDSPMTADDYVESVMIVADGNPSAEVVTFNFTPASGAATAKTRVRLAKTQNIVAVAKMNDGSFQMAKSQVKVTIGGCGG